MTEEIIESAIQAIKSQLRQLGKGPGQRVAWVTVVEVQAKFSGEYFQESIKRLDDRGFLATDEAGNPRFFMLTEAGYLWLQSDN
ncbi:hypothetical protein [Xanthomonas arboricola]|uniref:hypothetical protein n=1 Tax=Xanthomonas arboricola TaxID=56448 RepID=UPI002B30B879|nr:hypothetical protein X12_001764 [Xanthomonas arboricola]